MTLSMGVGGKGLAVTVRVRVGVTVGVVLLRVCVGVTVEVVLVRVCVSVGLEEVVGVGERVGRHIKAKERIVELVALGTLSQTLLKSSRPSWATCPLKDTSQYGLPKACPSMTSSPTREINMEYVFQALLCDSLCEVTAFVR